MADIGTVETGQGELKKLNNLVQFKNARPGRVVEIGQGAFTPLLLENTGFNYIGVDSDELSNRVLSQFAKNKDWVRSVDESIFHLDGDGVDANEVWIGNFRGVIAENNDQTARNLFEKADEMLAPGGEVVFLNTYDEVSDKVQENLSNILTQMGYEVRPIDLETDEHPFVKGFREFEKRQPNIPNFGGKAPTPFGFIATKA